MRSASTQIDLQACKGHRDCVRACGQPARSTSAARARQQGGALRTSVRRPAREPTALANTSSLGLLPPAAADGAKRPTRRAAAAARAGRQFGSAAMLRYQSRLCAHGLPTRPAAAPSRSARRHDLRPPAAAWRRLAADRPAPVRGLPAHQPSADGACPATIPAWPQGDRLRRARSANAMPRPDRARSPVCWRRGRRPLDRRLGPRTPGSTHDETACRRACCPGPLRHVMTSVGTSSLAALSQGRRH